MPGTPDPYAILQYWMFYPSSTAGTPNAHTEEIFHEGDWECFIVVLKRNTAARVLVPYAGVASQHYTGERRCWEDVETENCGRTPVVYVAGGSHATYFAPASFTYKEVAVWPDYVDYTSPKKASPVTYQLRYESDYLHWEGHWGARKIHEVYDAALAPSFGEGTSSGCRSPYYRGNRADVNRADYIGIVTNPKAWINSLPTQPWQPQPGPGL